MKLKPFKAYRYNANVVGDVGACIAPPYDVINEKQQADLYAQSPHNIVRVIQGKTNADDTEANSVYTRAADYIQTWIKEQALVEDAEECLYGYVQDFEVAETAMQRQSFISLVELEPFDEGGAVLPHEEILKGPIKDRLALNKATEAKFGLVFLLYDDPELIAEKAIEQAMAQEPAIDFKDEQGVRHRLYPIADKAQQDAIITMMADRKSVIADGHHRYTTGLALAEESTLPGAKYQMVTLANAKQDGVVVLSTHRLVHALDDFSVEGLKAKLAADFQLEALPFTDDQFKTQAKETMLQALRDGMDAQRCVFGIYAADSNFYIARLTNPEHMDEVASEMSSAWRGLDVAILHKLILEEQLGIDKEKLSSGKYLTYVKDTPTAIDDSIQQVDDGKQQAAFFTNPIRFEQLFEVTVTGERMPQKSTYFYPKMYTGLTVYKM